MTDYIKEIGLFLVTVMSIVILFGVIGWGLVFFAIAIVGLFLIGVIVGTYETIKNKLKRK